MRYTDWNTFFAAQMPLLKQIREHVAADRGKGNVYPAPADVFRAFAATPLRDVKVVILGQDPYHGAGQADGLAFSVRDGVPLPPSLKNIFMELDSDWYELLRQTVLRACDHVNRNGDYIRSDGLLGLSTTPRSGDLSAWTRQGVLLLNTALTVREGDAGSHLDIWRPFTDEVVRAVVDSATIAPHFVLWGSKARATFERSVYKLVNADYGDSLILRPKIGRRVTATHSAHPSPLSAERFFGSRPFSRANLALRLNNPSVAGVEIDWRLP